MILIIGGGTMGAGIAVSCLMVGKSVTLYEISDEAVAAARSRVSESLTRLKRRNPDLDVEATLANFATTTELGAVAGNKGVEFVIEAIPEDMALKQGLFTELDELFAASEQLGTILASNTSSLSISKIAEAAGSPGRVIGIHFFNPVPVSQLVELVVGAETNEATIAAANAFAVELGKTPITVNDSPGFASSRLGLVIGLEAIRMLESGVASAADIDTAMELGYKHPMGPLRLTDLVGLDVRLAIAENLAATLGERFEPPALLRDMVASGKLGKKTGQGFYTW